MGEASIWDWLIVVTCLVALLTAIAVANRIVGRRSRRPPGGGRARTAPEARRLRGWGRSSPEG